MARQKQSFQLSDAERAELLAKHRARDEAQTPTTVRWLLRDREQTYGAVWLDTGRVLALLGQLGLLERIISSNYFYNWNMALGKMLRLLASPGHIDSWRDLAGYATLVAEHLEREAGSSK